MSRDHRKLHVFKMADELAFDIYRSTQEFPTSERFGLQSQLRCAATSVASNIVEGSARRYPAEYRGFINMATASSAETAYLLNISGRLGLLKESDNGRLRRGYEELTASLKALLRSLEQAGD